MFRPAPPAEMRQRASERRSDARRASTPPRLVPGVSPGAPSKIGRMPPKCPYPDSRRFSCLVVSGRIMDDYFRISLPGLGIAGVRAGGARADVPNGGHARGGKGMRDCGGGPHGVSPRGLPPDFARGCLRKSVECPRNVRIRTAADFHASLRAEGSWTTIFASPLPGLGIAGVRAGGAGADVPNGGHARGGRVVRDCGGGPRGVSPGGLSPGFTRGYFRVAPPGLGRWWRRWFPGSPKTGDPSTGSGQAQGRL
jgi:hypothetical protein